MPSLYLLTGFIIQSVAVVIRAKLYNNRRFHLDKKYACLTSFSIIGCLFALIGFFLLSHADAHCGVDYNIILTVLALLSAGIISGFFTFSYQYSGDNDRWFPNLISVGFSLLFYLLFGAVSFYTGKSQNIHSIEYASTIVPIIMAIILVVNTLFDFWDYPYDSEEQQ